MATKKKRATKKRARPAARKKRTTTTKRKPKLSERELAATFTRAVSAGARTMAQKLARELKRHSTYGVYSAGGITANDLRAYEALTRRKRGFGAAAR